MKNILIVDSYHGDSIAKILKGFWGDEVNVYYEKDIRIFLLTDSFKEVAAGEGKKIDVFFLSGKLILDRMIILDEVKRRFGTPDSKVVAMSTMPSFIQKIKDGSYNVDFFLDKSLLYGSGDFEDLSLDDQQLFRSFLQ